MFVTEQLDNEIRKKYTGQRIGLRGVVLSLGDEVRVEKTKVKSIQEVLMDGTEMLLPHNPNISRDSLRGGEYGIIYGVTTTEHFREQASPEKRDWLFPGFLVYDRSKLLRETGGRSGCSYILPTSNEERSKVILGVYILDLFTLEK